MDSQYCMECTHRPTELYCTCTNPETLLCVVCLLPPLKKLTGKGHSSWPLSDLFNDKDPQHLERQKTLTTIQTQAREGVMKGDRAIEQYSTLVEKVIREIRTEADQTVEQLITVRAQLSAEVEVALEEVNSG